MREMLQAFGEGALAVAAAVIVVVAFRWLAKYLEEE